MITLDSILHQESWCAFALAVLSPTFLVPEQAFTTLAHGKSKQRKDIAVEDILAMIKFKKTMTYEQVGNIYGLRADAVCKKIKNFERLPKYRNLREV